MRNIVTSAVLAALLGLCTAPAAHAWGATRMTTTYVNPRTGGVGQYSRTAAWGPNGVYGGRSVSGYGAHGAYSAGGYHAYSPYGYGAYGGYHAYSPSMYRGYSFGGFAGDEYRGGVYRRW